jgi:hypothetical protein
MCASPNNSTDGDNKGVRVQQRRAGLNKIRGSLKLLTEHPPWREAGVN